MNWTKIPLHHALQDQGFGKGDYSLYHWVKAGPHESYWILHHNDDNPPTVGRLDGRASAQEAKDWADKLIQ